MDRRGAGTTVKALAATVAVVLVMAMVAGGSQAGPGAACSVTLNNGPVLGTLIQGVCAYRGVPYAKPPLNDLRWRPPQPAAPWKPSTLQATNYGKNCLQSSNFDPPMPPSALSEDCLFLNVFVRGAGVAKAPVLFWVHGGGYTGGGSNESRLNGVFDATLEEVVVVTINYRLNVFGFLGSEALRTRSADGSTGNYGIQDQRLALQWVQENIWRFGGDPTRVLLVGESAGAGSVSNHLVMPRSRGLFARAGMESGAFSTWVSQPMAHAQSSYDAFLVATNCSQAANPVACLVAKPGPDLIAAFKLAPRYAHEKFQMRPTEDGVELEAAAWKLARAGQVAPGVAVLAGSNLNDDVLGLPAPNSSEAGFASWVGQLFPGSASAQAKIVARYSKNLPPATVDGGRTYSSWYWAGSQVAADAVMSCAARRTARWFSGQGAYLYWFVNGPTVHAPGRGTYHSAEIPFVFHVLKAAEATMQLQTPEQVKLSLAMVRHWVAFAATGNPNGAGSRSSDDDVAWPAYINATDTALVFNATITTVPHLKKDRCDLWDELLFRGDYPPPVLASDVRW